MDYFFGLADELVHLATAAARRSSKRPGLSTATVRGVELPQIPEYGLQQLGALFHILGKLATLFALILIGFAETLYELPCTFPLVARVEFHCLGSLPLAPKAEEHAPAEATGASELST